MKKYCINCGCKMDSDATFCVECGSYNKGEYKSSFSNDSEPVTANPFAIIGLVLSFIIPTIGLILSIIGLVFSNKHDNIGKKPAIVGIIISSIGLVLLFAYNILSIILQN